MTREEIFSKLYDDEVVYRSPIENGSALLEVTKGCSWGKCLFCDFTRDKKGIVPLSRIEENQKTAMGLWMECGNNEPMFALRFPSQKIRLLKYSDAMDLEEIGIKALSGGNLIIYTFPLRKLL